IADYIGTLIGSKSHRENTGRYIRTLARECGWSCLGDLKRSDLESWLATEARKGRSARSRNAFRIAASGLCTWLVSVKRLAVNPFAGMAKADVEADPRRNRRALSEDEFRRLLEAARGAPARPPGRLSRRLSDPRSGSQDRTGPTCIESWWGPGSASAS